MLLDNLSTVVSDIKLSYQIGLLKTVSVVFRKSTIREKNYPLKVTKSYPKSGFKLVTVAPKLAMTKIQSEQFNYDEINWWWRFVTTSTVVRGNYLHSSWEEDDDI